MSLLLKLKKLAVVLTDNTILITDKLREYKDFIVVMDRAAPKSKIYNILLNGKRHYGYLVDMRKSSIRNELAQEVVRKQIVEQLVRGLTRKRFDFSSFTLGLSAGGIIGIIFGLLYPKLFAGKAAQEVPQPVTPTPVTITNPFQPIAQAIMIVGILAVVAYFGFKFYEKWVVV